MCLGKSCRFVFILVLLTSCRSIYSGIGQNQRELSLGQGHRINFFRAQASAPSFFSEDSFSKPKLEYTKPAHLSSHNAEWARTILQVNQTTSLEAFTVSSKNGIAAQRHNAVSDKVCFSKKNNETLAIKPLMKFAGDSSRTLEPHIKWGVLSSTISFFVIPVLAGPFGIILSWMGYRRLKKSPNTFWGKGLAWLGIGMGVISFFFGFYLLLFAIAFLV